MGYFMKAIQIMTIASAWSAKALEDGKVTLREAADLAEKIAQVLGIDVDLDIEGME